MLVIREKKPDGKTSFKNIYNVLENGIRASKDMRPVYNGIINDIKQAVKYTFSDANPSGWAALKETYKSWKVKNGYPATIGIMSGALKSSLVDSPRIKIGAKKMKYSYNPNVRSTVSMKSTGFRRLISKSRNKRVGDYAHYFDNKRPIFGYAREYINDLLKKISEKYVKDNMKSTKLAGGKKYV